MPSQNKEKKPNLNGIYANPNESSFQAMRSNRIHPWSTQTTGNIFPVYIEDLHTMKKVWPDKRKDMPSKKILQSTGENNKPTGDLFYD